MISQYGGCRLSDKMGTSPCSTSAIPGNDEYVELYNPTAAAVDVAGWFIQRRSAGGTASCWASIPAGTTIAANGFLLVGGAGYDKSHYGGVAADVQLTTDGTALTGMNESVVLLSNTASSCTTNSATAAIDSVSLGMVTDKSAALLLPALSFGVGNGQGIERKPCSNATNDTNATTGILAGGGEALSGNSFKSGASATDWLMLPSPGPRSSATAPEPTNCP